MSRGIKVSKEGVDVKTAANKDLLISSEFDTFKIAKTGSLVISLSAETVNFSEVIREATYAHGLGYVPFYGPLTRGVLYGLDEYLGGDYAGKLENGGDYILNDIEEVRIPAVGYSPAIAGESVGVFVSSTNLILRVKRFNAMPEDVKFGARKCTLYYTIFHNRVDEQFNLL
jgi:hypothetical protein